MLNNVEQCRTMLGNVEHCWTTLNIIEQCWTMRNNAQQLWTPLNNDEQRWTTLDNVEQCWSGFEHCCKLMNNVEQCWTILNNVRQSWTFLNVEFSLQCVILSLVSNEENERELLTAANHVLDMVKIRNRFLHRQLSISHTDSSDLPTEFNGLTKPYLQFLWNMFTSDPKYKSDLGIKISHYTKVNW